MMGIDSGYRLGFRTLAQKDLVLLERWYGMTDSFGYATGFKNFTEIRQILLEPIKPNRFISMLDIGEDKRTIGFIYGEIKIIETKSVLWIYTLIIEPSIQHKGVGTCAINKFLQFIKIKYGPLTCFVSVLDKNTQGLSFWENAGFSHSSVMEEPLNQIKSSRVAILKRNIK